MIAADDPLAAIASAPAKHPQPGIHAIGVRFDITELGRAALAAPVAQDVPGGDQ